VAIAAGVDTPDGWAFTSQASGVIDPATYLPNVNVGDLVIATYQIVADMTGFTPPAGWSVATAQTHSSYGFSFAAFYKTYAAGDDTWNWGSSVSGQLWFCSFSGADFDASDVWTYDTANDTVAEWGSVAVSDPNGAVLAIGHQQGTSSAMGAGAVPSGYVEWYNAVPGSLRPLLLAYDLTPTGAGGTEDPANGTTVGNRPSAHTLISLAEAAAAAGGGGIPVTEQQAVITPYYF